LDGHGQGLEQVNNDAEKMENHVPIDNGGAGTKKGKKEKKELYGRSLSFILRSWTIFIGKLTVYANQTLRLQAYNNQSRKNCESVTWSGKGAEDGRNYWERKSGGVSARLKLEETIKFEDTCKENIAVEKSASESSNPGAFSSKDLCLQMLNLEGNKELKRFVNFWSILKLLKYSYQLVQLHTDPKYLHQQNQKGFGTSRQCPRGVFIKRSCEIKSEWPPIWLV